MKKKLGGLLMLAALGGGCVSTSSESGGGGGGGFMSHVGPGGSPVACGPAGCSSAPYQARAVPGVMDALGGPVLTPGGGHVSAPYAGMPKAGRLNEAQTAARADFAQSVPPQIAAKILKRDDRDNGIGLLAGGILPGSPFMQEAPIIRTGALDSGENNLMQAGGPPMPGPGPAGLGGPIPPMGSGLPGAVAAIGALKDGAGPFAPARTSLRFAGPNGMKVQWYVPSEEGKPQLIKDALETPGRYNFLQAAIYRLKLSNIPGRPGLELYPTLEVVPANNKTSTFLAHSSVPLTFTQEDFDQVTAGNYLVKVVYLPHPQFQDLAIGGPNEIVSSRLEPGADPIAEALQRGSILLVVRLGNIDLEAPNTPPIDAPSPFKPFPPGFGMGMPSGMPGPNMGGLPPMPGMPMMGGMPPMGGGGMPPPGMGGLPQGGPMVPGMFPPPGSGMMPPPGLGAPSGPASGMLPPTGARSVTDSMEQAGEEAQEPPAKKKSSSWLPWGSKKSK